MENITSGFRAAGAAMYSAGQAASRQAGSAVSWLGRKITWVASSIKPSIAMARSGGVNANLKNVKNFATSSDQSSSTASSITTSVAVEATPPKASLQSFVCHEAVARAMDDHPPSGMSPKAKTNLNSAIIYLNLLTKPGISKAQKESYKNLAVALTQNAIKECPKNARADINETLSKLGTQYDSLLEQATQSDEFSPAEIKAELRKTAQASLSSQETKAPAVSQKTPNQIKCDVLKTKLAILSADSKLSSYAKHFETAQSHLKQAEQFYRAGNSTLGDQQYLYAHRLADTPRYMALRTKLGITQVQTGIGNEDLHLMNGKQMTQGEITRSLEKDPFDTSLEKYSEAVSNLRAASSSSSVEEYEKFIGEVQKYTPPT